MVRALPSFNYKGRHFTIDARLNEVRSMEFRKEPIFLSGKKANALIRKAYKRPKNDFKKMKIPRLK